MFVAYRGFSVIMFAPVAALGAVFADRCGRGPRHNQRRLYGEHGRFRQKLLSGVLLGTICKVITVGQMAQTVTLMMASRPSRIFGSGTVS